MCDEHIMRDVVIVEVFYLHFFMDLYIVLWLQMMLNYVHITTVSDNCFVSAVQMFNVVIKGNSSAFNHLMA